MSLACARLYLLSFVRVIWGWVSDPEFNYNTHPLVSLCLSYPSFFLSHLTNRSTASFLPWHLNTGFNFTKSPLLAHRLSFSCLSAFPSLSFLSQARWSCDLKCEHVLPYLYTELLLHGNPQQNWLSSFRSLSRFFSSVSGQPFHLPTVHLSLQF